MRLPCISRTYQSTDRRIKREFNALDLSRSVLLVQNGFEATGYTEVQRIGRLRVVI